MVYGCPQRGKVNERVLELIRSAEHPKRDRITFLCGMAGPLAILYKVRSGAKKSVKIPTKILFIKKLFNLVQTLTFFE